MAIDKNFARRFKEANDGLDRAFQIKNEPQTIYYFGLLSGMLATVLPEQEARALTSVNGMSPSAIHLAIAPVLRRAKDVLAGELNG